MDEKPPREFKDGIYAHIARIGKALSSGPRLELLDLLAQGPQTVEVLARQAGQSTANTSRHLQVLRREQLVAATREGVHMRYRVADDDIGTFFESLRHLAERRLLELERLTQDFYESRGVMETIQAVDRDALIARIQKGEVTVLDVRPHEEFAAGHIPGALSMPIETLEARLEELPEGEEVVAYCRGPYCVMAIEAVQRLQSLGYTATHLDEGVAQWRARGLRVEVVSTQGQA